MIAVDKTDSNVPLIPLTAINATILPQPDTAYSVEGVNLEGGLNRIQPQHLVATASEISLWGWRVTGVEVSPLDDKNILYYRNDSVTKSPLLFAFDVALEELDEVVQEAEEISQLDSDTESIPQQAYEDTKTILRHVPYGTLPPEFTWLIDGGIGIEWVEDDKNLRVKFVW